jgi:hypothetical protein
MNRCTNRAGFTVSVPSGFGMSETEALSRSLARAIASRPVPTSTDKEKDEETDRPNLPRFRFSETAELHLLGAALSHAPARDAHTRESAHTPAREAVRR